MKGIIILNGEPYLGEIDGENAYVLCVDGGYNWAKDRLKIDENIGDFDSVKTAPTPAPKEVYPCEKDKTDGELAIERILQLFAEGKIDSVDIYGAGGGREDHFLGNVHLLYRMAQAGLPCVAYTNQSMLFAFAQGVTLTGLNGVTVSLLPLGGDAEIEKTQGFYYPADGVVLRYGSCRGVSNVIVSDRAEIIVKFGIALCVVNA